MPQHGWHRWQRLLDGGEAHDGRHVAQHAQSAAVRRSFQHLRGHRIYSVNVLNFQSTVFISNFMHMRDKTVCVF